MMRSDAVVAKTTIQQKNGLYVKFTSTPTDNENVQFDYFMPPEYVQRIEYQTVTLSISKEGIGEVSIHARIRNNGIVTSTLASSRDATEVTFNIPGYTEGDILDISVIVYGTVTIHYVKLELGNYATPLTHRTYSEELMECMRFYQRLTYFYCTTHEATNSLHETLFLKMPMRSSPTIKPISSTFHKDTININKVTYQYIPGGTVRFNPERKAEGFMRIYNETIELEAELI